MTAGLSSAPACVRVIIRDVAGKHSWDSAVLYGPPPSSPSSPTHTFLPFSQMSNTPNLRLRLPPGTSSKAGGNRDHSEEEAEDAVAGSTEGERQGTPADESEGQLEGASEEVRGAEEDEDGQKNEDGMDGELAQVEQLLAPPSAKRVCREAVPAWDSMTEGDDALDEMLQYLGYSSPECLQRAGAQTHATHAFPTVNGRSARWRSRHSRLLIGSRRHAAQHPRPSACLCVGEAGKRRDQCHPEAERRRERVCHSCRWRPHLLLSRAASVIRFLPTLLMSTFFTKFQLNSIFFLIYIGFINRISQKLEKITIKKNLFSVTFFFLLVALILRSLRTKFDFY